MINIRSFTSLPGPWLHLWIGHEPNIDCLFEDYRSLHQSEIIIKVIRGNKCPTKDALFDEFGAALQFPSYFGRNWDALDECITDLEWLPGKAYILFVTHANDVLVDQDSEFKILISVLENAAQEWAESHGDDELRPRPAIPFHVIFHCQPSMAEYVRGRLLRTGAELSDVVLGSELSIR